MFKEFSLFDIYGYPVRGTRLVKSNRIPGNIPLVTAGETNQGIAEYISNPEQQTFNNMLTIDMFGHCFYRNYQYKADDNILSFGNGHSTECCLYVAAAVNRAVIGYNYGQQYRLNSYMKTTISLPVIESPDPDHVYTSDDIDWQYMQDRIAELERDRIAELDAYLKVTELDDYELDDDDKQVLADSKTHVLDDFKVKDILPPIKVKKYAKKPMTEGNVPFVSCQSTNNGIAAYCDEKPEIKHCITVSTNGNCFDCFWHDYPIIPSSDVEVLSKDGITDDREISLYLCGVLAPNTKLYSYSNKPKNGKVFDATISLPVIESPDPDHVYTSDDIDWQYMRRYIRAIEKLAIADVVKFKDRELAVTRQVVSQSQA